MRIDEMRLLTREELEQKRRDLAEERFNLRMRKSFKQLENPLRLRQLRREIARINTVLCEDEKGLRILAKSRKSLLEELDATGKEKK
ncbi:MAG: 50S ribosomal protein L29 [Candidatus Zixiibacteriota bacterium]